MRRKFSVDQLGHAESICDVLDQGLVARCLHSLVRRRVSWRVRRDERVDVCRLRQLDAAVAALRDLDVQQVGDRALVLHLPVERKLLGEGVVDGVLVLVREEREEVVDVDADDEGLLARAASGVMFISRRTKTHGSDSVATKPARTR